MGDNCIVRHALEIAGDANPLLETPKARILRLMLSALRSRDEYADTENFNEVLALVKQKDAKYEAENLTEVHPLRYQLGVLIEKAENILKNE